MTAPQVVRDVTPVDLAALQFINPEKAPTIHLDRIRDARKGYLRYLMLEQRGVVAGYGVLVFRRPPSWSDAASREHLPQAVDLYVQPEKRDQGLGSYLLKQFEAIAASAGANRLFIGVDPVENPRAYALYVRLGYEPLDLKARRVGWRFTDSEGCRHEGNSWNIDLVRCFTKPSA